MSPALPTASSKVTPSDSHPPTIDRGPPRDDFWLVVSFCALVVHASPHISNIHNSLTHNGGIRGELIIKGHNNIRGCSGTLHMTTILASDNSTLLLFLIRYDEWRGFQLLHGGFIILFINYHEYSISNLTDLSASNDVSMIFQGHIEEWNSKFPHS